MGAPDGFRSAVVYMNCPACGDGAAEWDNRSAYEFGLDRGDVFAEISMPCDGCGVRICVSLDVTTQTEEATR